MDDKHMDFEFKAENSYEYTLILSMVAKNAHINRIFNLAKERLMDKKNIKVEGDIDKIRKFDVDRQFLNVIKTIIKRKVRWIEKHLKGNKIEVLTSNMDKCYFQRNEEEDWEIYIILKGEYVDKR
jgi:hypothetical protein